MASTSLLVSAKDPLSLRALPIPDCGTQVLTDMVRMRSEHLRVCEEMEEIKEKLTRQAQEQVQAYLEQVQLEHRELEEVHFKHLENLKQKVMGQQQQYELLVQELEAENVDLTQNLNTKLAEAKGTWGLEKQRLQVRCGLYMCMTCVCVRALHWSIHRDTPKLGDPKIALQSG